MSSNKDGSIRSFIKLYTFNTWFLVNTCNSREPSPSMTLKTRWCRPTILKKKKKKILIYGNRQVNKPFSPISIVLHVLHKLIMFSTPPM